MQISSIGFQTNSRRFKSVVFSSSFYLKLTQSDSNPLMRDLNPICQLHFCLIFGLGYLNPTLKDLNPSPGCWIFSTLSEAFASRVRFIYETLSNLIKNNNTSVLVSSKSNKGSTISLFLMMTKHLSNDSRILPLNFCIHKEYINKHHMLPLNICIHIKQKTFPLFNSFVSPPFGQQQKDKAIKK